MSNETTVTFLDDDQWDTLVGTSPQASPFNRREFLDALGTRSIRLGVKQGDAVLAGVAVQVDDAGTPVGPPDTFGYYQGIMLSPHFDSLPEHSRSRKELEVTAKLLAGLTARYRNIWLGFHWRFRDLRPLQWFNYHQPDAGQFQLTLHYTGILDLSRVSSVEAYADSLGKGRIGDLRKARRNGIEVHTSEEVDILDELHRLTFSRQGANRGCLEFQLKSMARATIRHGFGELLVARTRSGDPVSVSLFVWDKTTGHYLFGASDPAYRDTGAATLVMLESVARAMQRSLSHIDFVGINSPQRGAFKTSFNAVPVPYFDAQWHRPD